MASKHHKDLKTAQLPGSIAEEETSILEQSDILECTTAEALTAFIANNPEALPQLEAIIVTSTGMLHSPAQLMESFGKLENFVVFLNTSVQNITADFNNLDPNIAANILAQFVPLIGVCEQQLTAIEQACLNDLNAANLFMNTTQSAPVLFSKSPLNAIPAIATIHPDLLIDTSFATSIPAGGRTDRVVQLKTGLTTASALCRTRTSLKRRG